MNCEQIEPWISADQDGELDARRRRIVREHLARCSACRTLSQEWEALAGELRAGLTRREAPESLHARVMRRIPETEPAPVRGGRAGSWRPQGWFSLGLVPLGAATAWLLVAPHVTRPAPLLPGKQAAEMLAAVPPSAPPGSAMISPGPSLEPASAGTPRTKPKANARPKPPRRLRGHPEPAAAIRPGKAQGSDHPETGLQRRMRRLRPRRWRYPVAERPRRGWAPQRAHSWVLLASRPLPPPATPDSDAAAPASRISVVDYVLPEVQPPLPAPEAETDFVLRPAEPVPASQAGFNL